MPSLTTRGHSQRYWRSLEELARSPEFMEHLNHEFPALRDPTGSEPSRRDVIKIMGASLALAGLTGCRWPRETIVPYAKRPTGRIEGAAVHYASSYELGGVGRGVLVASYDGRPIKIEGNELHSASLGASDALGQAAILEIYDPDRSTRPSEGIGDRRRYLSPAEFDAAFGKLADEARARQGAGLCILSGASGSPSFAAARAALLKALPQAQWFEYEPLSRDNERAGTALAFGAPHRPVWSFQGCTLIAAFDSDFLLTHPDALRCTREFAARRTGEGDSMLRLYSVESTLSLTGSNADYRFAVRSADVFKAMCDVTAALLDKGLELPPGFSGLVDAVRAGTSKQAPAPFAARIAADLLSNRGHGLVAVGPRQPAAAHALAALLNVALGNASKSVSYVADLDPARPTHLDQIRTLTGKLNAGEVETLVILGGNPVYDAPADLGFAAALSRAKNSLHLGLFADETAELCGWHVPQAHWLESWHDTRGWDGLYSVAQPLIEPLYSGVSATELVARLGSAAVPAASGYELVRKTFQAEYAGGASDFEAAWRRALHDGIVDGSAWPRVSPTVAADAVIAGVRREIDAWQPADAAGFELVFAQDNRVYDGRFANNGWLQELPDPLTKITWDNAALISPVDARRLGLRRDDLITLALAERSLTLPVCVVPGQAPGSITLALGYGRRRGGQVARSSGFDTYALRTTGAWPFAGGARLTAARRSHELATTQDHHAIASTVGDDEIQRRVPELVIEGTFAEFREHPDFAAHRVHSLPLHQPFNAHEFPDAHRWAMAVDLSKCTGCSACVVACQAENNVPVVGRGEVLMGREMHWVRIDRYFLGDPFDADDIRVVHAPIYCQQCENAPCEQVCPVAATVHDADGLNVMVYNRCIGTRYCANNCPWKVRRFNWFWNHHGPKHPRSLATGKPYYFVTPPQTDITAVEQMAHNPKVTVRTRGVMEKCTFCLQRINAARIAARNEAVSPTPAGQARPSPLRDGAVVPACAQACPADALVFGDLNDAESRVSQQHAHPRSYAMLSNLNARPRNKFLAKLRQRDDGHAGHAPDHDQPTPAQSAQHLG